MIYTVVWRPAAENQLADLWINSSDQREVSKAADEMDNRLRHNPQAQGESRASENVRILVIEPLAALFEISDADCLVAVLKVWRSRAQ